MPAAGKETFALLAPVPGLHLHGAQEICEQHGRVAFGSNAFDLFRKLKDQIGIQEKLPVLIYASRTGSEHHSEFFSANRVSFIGRFANWIEPHSGEHPNSDIRPKTALAGDSKWAGFWEVESLIRLHRVSEQIHFAQLKTVKAEKPNKVVTHEPEGPLLVVVDVSALPKLN